MFAGKAARPQCPTWSETVAVPGDGCRCRSRRFVRALSDEMSPRCLALRTCKTCYLERELSVSEILAQLDCGFYALFGDAGAAINAERREVLSDVSVMRWQYVEM